MNRPLVLGFGLLILFSSATHAGSGGFLGVMIEGIDDGLREELGFDGMGVYVSSLVDGGPAEKAGLKEDDVIIELDGEKVIGTGHLRDMLAYHSAGDKVKVKVWRGGKKETIEVVLDEQKSMVDDIKRQIKKKILVHKGPTAWLGVKLQSLGTQLAEYFGAEKGVLLAEVIEGSPAASAGLQAGDVVVKVDGEEVEEPSHFQKLVGKHDPGDRITITFVRSEKEMSKEVELGDVPEDQKSHGMMQWFGGHHFNCLPFDPGCCPKGVEVEVFTDRDEDFEDLEQFKTELEQELQNLKVEIQKLQAELEERD